MDYRTRYGDWALIIGASQGLGKAIAEETARRGMNLVMVARRPGPLDEAAKAIAAAHGVETRTISVDLADPAIDGKLAVSLGDLPISFMVYNAAAEPQGEFMKQDVASHMENIHVNVITPTLLVHRYGRLMIERRKGGIVICSSLAANQGIYNYVSYGAAKAYEMLLGEGLWEELGDYGVDACTLMVGSTYTPNFIEKQKGKDGLFAQSRTPQNMPEGVTVPQLPEDAAANLFSQIDKAWLPLIYANPVDEQRAEALRSMSRVEVIKRMSGAMRTGFRTAMA